MSYGYETQVPPIYTLAFFNAIANGGRYMRPYFVSEIRRQDQVIKTFEPTVVREQICKPETLTAIQEMLRRVVTEGTGKKARSPLRRYQREERYGTSSPRVVVATVTPRGTYATRCPSARTSPPRRLSTPVSRSSVDPRASSALVGA